MRMGTGRCPRTEAMIVRPKRNFAVHPEGRCKWRTRHPLYIPSRHRQQQQQQQQHVDRPGLDSIVKILHTYAVAIPLLLLVCKSVAAALKNISAAAAGDVDRSNVWGQRCSVPLIATSEAVSTDHTRDIF